ncbi:Major Facilitator Superfamily [Methanocella conradii HZ254]|uniref:Major Facilitator Superfamily n=1 Tax=Methanocella conradii (strain DSM 24694 / JCM 17849 / CGMCC 1.5162 / HZ254) TaxID=1041930 RepID=H8I939_METCZ|nr:MFS transporter [Methanocella conradii]AFC99042.1 Major Facilitator Superfamily [Methanocella conradii HZ254]
MELIPIKYKDVMALLSLSLVGFTASFTGHLISSNLGNYMGSFGSSMTAIGLVIGSLAIAEVLFKTPFGILSDRYGKLKLMLGGLALLAIISMMFPLFKDPAALFTIRFMQGVAIAAFSTTSTAMVADLFTDRKGEAMGTYNSLKGAGYALGPILGGLVTQYFNFFDTFLLCAAASATVLVLCLVAVKESFTPPKKRRSVGLMLKESNRLDYVSCYFIGMSGMLAFYSIISFLPVYGTINGIGAGVTGAILGVQAVVYVLAQYYSGKAADKYGSRLPIMIGSVLLAAGILLIALVPSPLAWGVAVILSGLGISALWVVSNSYLAYAAPAALMGTVMGLSGTFKEVGDGGGPILIGFLGDWIGLKGAFLCILIFLALSFILALTLDNGVGQKSEAKTIEAIKAR